MYLKSFKYYICYWFPPDRTWHKVNDPKADYSGDLGEWMVGHEPRLEPCWSMLLIVPLTAMWARWAKLILDPNLGQGTDAWLKLKVDSKVQCYTRGTKVSMLQLAYLKVVQPKLGAFRPRICHWFRYPIQHECKTAHPRPDKYDIYGCLPPDRTWHKVNELKADYSRDLGEMKVWHESRLEPCWSVLLIDPLNAMWARWAKLFLGPKSGSRHGCLVIA